MEARNKLLYPMLLVAAFSVTAFSVVGIATMTGKIPSAHSEVVDAAGAAAKNAEVPAPPSAGRDSRDRRDTGARPLAASCPSCGVVESIRTIERKGAGTGVGAVAGGLTGAVVGNQIGGGHGRTAMAVLGGVGGAFVGNEIEKNVKKTTAFQIKIRMNDGSLRVTTQSTPPEVAVGDRVRVEDGAVSRNS